jgi:hypothetical protein
VAGSAQCKAFVTQNMRSQRACIHPTQGLYPLLRKEHYVPLKVFRGYLNFTGMSTVVLVSHEQIDSVVVCAAAAAAAAAAAVCVSRWHTGLHKHRIKTQNCG